MKRLLSYFIPQTLFRTSSHYNQDIAVRLIDGKPALVVNGVIQSGAGFTKIWRRVFDHFHIEQLERVKEVAVIGVGGGDVLHLLSNTYPGARVAAVDIDQKIISIAKKYFNVSSLTNIRFHARDAQDFIHITKKYDLIIVDLYIGNDIPDFLTQAKFLAAVKKRLSLRGVVIVNFLKASEVASSGEFKRVAKTIFSSVSSFDIAYNRFFLLTNF